MSLPPEITILNAIGLLLTLATIPTFFLVLRHRLNRRLNKYEDADALLSKVQPWQWEALSHLWTCQEYISKGHYGSFQLAGWIGAPLAAQQRPWVAFTVRGRFPDYTSLLFVGEGRAHTTEHTVEYSATSPGNVAITVNGQELGRLLPDGRLLDARGRPIGTQEADGGQLCAVTVKGRLIARVRCPASIHGDSLRTLVHTVQHARGKSLPQLDVAPALSSEERTWVLALAVWNVMLGQAFGATRHED